MKIIQVYNFIFIN